LYVGADISVTNFRPIDNPTFNNFWNQDIPVTQYTFQSGTYNGKPMQYVALKKVVLYPQKTGELQLEPLALDVTAEVPTNRRDFFGGRLYAQTNKTVTAGNRTIQVKPLPEAGKPASFSGAVGKFDFFVRTSKNILNANESLQAVVEVNGNGNLKLFKVPKLKLPAALEVYEPEFEEKITTNLSGMRGKISNSYTVVPAYKGKYPIPSVAFSYFDPSLEKYITLDATPVVVNVIEGPTYNENPKNENNTVTTATKQAVAENNAFGFIKTKTTLVPLVQSAFFNGKTFWLLCILPFALLLLTVLTHRFITTKKTDQASALSKRSQRLAKKFLSEAKGKKANKDAFYVALEKGLQLYLKGKLKLDNADFNKENIYNIFNKKSISKETTGLLITLLEHCEAARYSPFTAVEIEADYLNAISAISQLDTQL
ncbi:BatD family protein, partial [Flavobacteriaceae bacterium]|nr:BatD family protein [Flavobacteriaceae bacterium]